MWNLNRRTLLGAMAAGGAASVLPRITAMAQDGPIKIGLIGPMSGSLSVYGPALRLGTTLAADYYNAQGGVGGRNLEVVVKDDGANATNTLTAFRELLGEGVRLFVVGPNTHQILALQPLLADAGAIVTSVGPIGLSLTHENFVKNYFRANGSAYQYRGFTKTAALRYPEVKKWTAIYPDIESGRDIARWFGSGLTDFYAPTPGGSASITEEFKTKLGATDFRSQISEMMSNDTEGLMLALYGADGITFVNQARSFGLDKKFKVIMEVAVHMDMPKALKQNTPSTMWNVDQWDFSENNPSKLSKFVYDGFVTETNDPVPSWIVGRCADSVAAYVMALNQTKSVEAPALVAAMEDAEIDGASGKFRYRTEDHQVIDNEYRYIRFGPSTTNPLGWEIQERVTVNSDGMVEKPTPGKKYEGE